MLPRSDRGAGPSPGAVTGTGSVFLLEEPRPVESKGPLSAAGAEAQLLGGQAAWKGAARRGEGAQRRASLCQLLCWAVQIRLTLALP